ERSAHAEHRKPDAGEAAGAYLVGVAVALGGDPRRPARPSPRGAGDSRLTSNISPVGCGPPAAVDQPTGPDLPESGPWRVQGRIQARTQRGSDTSSMRWKTTRTGSPIVIVAASTSPIGPSALATRFPTRRMDASS